MGWLQQEHFCGMRKSCHGPLLQRCLWAVLHRTRLWAAAGCYKHEQHLPHCSWWLEASHFVLVTASLPLNKSRNRKDYYYHLTLIFSVNSKHMYNWHENTKCFMYIPNSPKSSENAAEKKNCLTDTPDMQALVCYKRISHAVCQQNIL